ncbi:Chorismate mutase [Zostera marina]|uniref:chorismate mutase n=1 Tax=Zostera marina TaxID=29655 RepID=A0A0K9PAY1_ZOSMR|nr:Chorismate mutase [Zostera marina]
MAGFSSSYKLFFLLLNLCYVHLLLSLSCASSAKSASMTLASVRNSLIKQEDTIIFCLIQRARFPINSHSYTSSSFLNGSSILTYYVKHIEVIQSEVGGYANPEEVPFFNYHLSSPVVPPNEPEKFLYPAAASVNISEIILKTYIEKLVPLFTSSGDDGQYALSVASDMACLQALSRRIHYGRFVAETKFRGAKADYISAINSQDKATLTKLITNKSVENTVKARVYKKAKIFGQNVSLHDNKSNTTTKYKVDPLVVSHIYGEWIIPLTKLVELEYLLRRLN